MSRLTAVIATLSLILCSAGASGEFTLHTFEKSQLTDQFWAEGANFGDFNKDGKMDVVGGPYWWEGPDFKKRHEYYPATKTFELKDGTASKTIPGFPGALGKTNAYSDNFFAFTHDFNKDGWDDILIYGFPGADASWYENPQGKEGHWKRNKIFNVVDNESPQFGDVDGDGKPDIICNTGGQMGYAVADWNDTAKPWTYRPVSPKGGWQRFTHGLGIGDVNGDGKLDLLDKDGWWEQPANAAQGGLWKAHPQKFGGGGAQMYVYDVNGDGRNDVITSLAAHNYGLAWFEQLEDGTFKQNLLVGSKPEDNKYGVKFSQPHAVDLVDMDGDGLKDIVTGKRFWAHGPGPGGDAEPNAAAVLYWFKLVRNANKSVDFVPYLIDDNSGIGTQVVAGDINGDKLPDVVVGNKRGVFVLIHKTKAVSQEEWEKAQPKPLAKP